MPESRAIVKTHRSGTDSPPRSPASPEEESRAASAWGPLRHPVFRGVWTASFASGIGTWMQNVGAARNSPAWQAILPDVVPARDLRPAVALNAMSVTLARAVGPALAGLVIAATSAGLVFLLNALSFLGVMLVLCRWRPEPRPSSLPTERTVGAIRAGLRYVRHAQPLRVVLWRTASFIVFGSILWALLPVLSRNLGLGSTGYGVLLGCFGIGAVAGGVFLLRPRQGRSTDSVLGSG